MTTLVPKYSRVTSANRSIAEKFAETISVRDYGAVGDFNPTTGVGTDDRVAIQAAFDYAKTVNGGCYVFFPSGSFYLGTGYTSSTAGLTSQLLLGSLSLANNVTNVTIGGEGATIYQGASGSALSIANANNVTITGLKMVGYAGGTLDPSRERDNLIGIFHSSKNITIQNCYITNSLGYTIYTVGNPNVAEGGTTETCLNIAVRNNIIKSRYGNGVSSASSGSASLWSFAAVDAQGVIIQNNVIYGALDFEPNNVAGQSTYGIMVDSNQFPAGFVTPVIPAGVSTYWADEVIGKNNSGGTNFIGTIAIGGATGAPVNGFNVVSNNSFDYGRIVVTGGVYYYHVVNNTFRLGRITVGSTSGGDVNRFYNISGNTAYSALQSPAFIVLDGSISQSNFHNNTLINDDNPVISWDGAGGADAGTNSYIGNSSLASSTNPTINLGPTGLATTSTQQSTKGAAQEVASFVSALTDGTNSATLSASTLWYRVDGRQITFTVRLFIDAAGSIGAGTYVKLPSSANSQAGMRYTCAVTTEQNFAPSANFTGLFGLIQEGTDKCFIYQMRTTGAPLGVVAANFGASSTLIVTGTYFTL